MKHYLLSILILALPFIRAKSQHFEFHSNAPFGIQSAFPDASHIAYKYMFADFDQDEDLDLILIGIDSIDITQGFYYKGITYFVDYQENVGDRKHPAFADRKPLLDDFPFVEGLFLPAIGDLDDDGRPDMVVVAEIDEIGSEHLLYYHQQSDGSFDVQRMDSMGTDPLLTRSTFLPELTDLDQDGDLDLLMSGYAPEFFDTAGTTSVHVFRYAKNIGSASNPVFLGWFQNPFGLVSDTVPFISVTGDINLDGDMDLLIVSSAENTTPFYFYENVPGTNGKPSFKLPVLSPFGLPQPEEDVNHVAPTLVDLDGDGDLDLFVYRADTSDTDVLQYYENTLITTGVKPVIDFSNQITVIPNPAREELTIVNSSALNVVSVHIFNNAGKLISSVRENLDKPVAVNHLPNGLYIISLRLSNGQDVLKKVIVMNE